MSYDANVKKWKKAYTDILAVCEKYPDFYELYSFNDLKTMQNSANDHLTLIEWYEKYGLKISHEYAPYSHNYFSLGNYMAFNHFGDAKKAKDNGSGKFISWSDNGNQPKDEWLFNIHFSTGAYIFGEDYKYQQQLFQDFFNELKTYSPDYSDTVNKSLYWKLENTKPIYTDFISILNKYREHNQSELNQRKADKLRKELQELEKEA